MNTKIIQGCLALMLAFSTTIASADAVDSLRQFYARTTTLQTHFTQKVLDEKGTVTDVMVGQLWLLRPTSFRWEYREPYVQIMVNDGKKLWMYDVDLAQVTVRDAQAALAGAPVWLLNGGPALDEQFLLVHEPSNDGLDWVKMNPKSEGGDFTQARMALKDGLPEILELTDSLGQKTVIEFSRTQNNVVIPAERFKFTPPPNVEVVEG